MASILDQIKARQAALLAKSTTDLPIPTWGTHGHPKAWLRVHPVDADFSEKQRAKALKVPAAGQARAALHAQAVIIAKATEAVLIGEGAEQASFTLDDPDLLAALGIPDCKSNAEAVQALVGNSVTGADGYLVAMSDAIARHSGHAAEVVEEEVQGD